jgi:flagellar protein FlaF
MNSYHAQQGYKTVQREMNSDKAIELKVFISITSSLSQVDPAEIGGAAALAQALVDNAKLWKILFIDLVNPENPMPMDLKQNLISLAEFTQLHTLKVLSGSADKQILIDINKSVISGLRESSRLKLTPKAAETAPIIQEAV